MNSFFKFYFIYNLWTFGQNIFTDFIRWSPFQQIIKKIMIIP